MEEEVGCVKFQISEECSGSHALAHFVSSQEGEEVIFGFPLFFLQQLWKKMGAAAPTILTHSQSIRIRAPTEQQPREGGRQMDWDYLHDGFKSFHRQVSRACKNKKIRGKTTGPGNPGGSMHEKDQVSQ